jgi:hypothetical protein
MSHEELPVFIRWEGFTEWLLNTTEKFPKRVRFTFSSRLDNFALDVLEKIIEAAYTKEKLQALKQANLNIQKMRVLFRICHKQRFIGNRSYEYAVKELYETGKMIGGWMKGQKSQ